MKRNGGRGKERMRVVYRIKQIEQREGKGGKKNS